MFVGSPRVCVCTVVPRVQGVVYFTRSLVEMENENVVNCAIEYVTTVQQTKMPFRVSPPVLPLTEVDVEEENPLTGKFLKFMPSNFSSGCFIAAITREVRHVAHHFRSYLFSLILQISNCSEILKMKSCYHSASSGILNCFQSLSVFDHTINVSFFTSCTVRLPKSVDIFSMT